MLPQLHSHSYYSLLDGVPSPEALVRQAARYDCSAIALTDDAAFYGVSEFSEAAKVAGVKPIFGSEITLTNGGHLTLLAENDEGYRNLSRIISLARRDQPKGSAALPWQSLQEYAGGIIALSGCQRSEISRAILNLDTEKAIRIAERYKTIFGPNNFFLERQLHREYGEHRVNDGLTYIGGKLRIKQVVTSDIHYLESDDAYIHQILTCIRQRVPLDQSREFQRNNQYYFRSPTETFKLFEKWSHSIRTTYEVAERCNATLPTGPQQFPLPDLSEGYTPEAYMRVLCEEGLTAKCAKRDLRPYRETLEHELAIIFDHQLTNYFLVVWDIMRFARRSGILAQGRGSAANSLVAYLLNITPVDPISCGLVFERFLSPNRKKTPDIDIDFANDRRDEVVQYIYQKYGYEHVAISCTINTFGAKSALNEAGFALGFSKEQLKKIGSQIDSHSAADLPRSERIRRALGTEFDSPRIQQLLTCAASIGHFPHYLGVHTGGMVISSLPLADYISVEPTADGDGFVTQHDKDGLDRAKLVKVDVLALGGPAAIQKSFDALHKTTGRKVDFYSMGFDDPRVYAAFGKRDTGQVFAADSPAQDDLHKRFKPRNFRDLTAMMALVRPGPVQAGTVDPFVNRWAGLEPTTYLHPLLESALAETYGVILYQEQVLEVARDLAGFTLEEGEQLRRALGNKHAKEEIEKFHQRFVDGALEKGVSRAIAERVFDMLRAFGSYSFSKGHAAAFAGLCYASAWLRVYFPLFFFYGILSNQPMGFWPAHVVVTDAIAKGVKILPVDLRYSEAGCTIEENAIRLGLDYVDNFGKAEIDALLDERLRRPFDSLEDLIRRTGLARFYIEKLVLSGAVDYLGERRDLYWKIAEAFFHKKKPQRLPLVVPDEQVSLIPMTALEKLALTFETTKVAIEDHITALKRDEFKRAGARRLKEIWRLPDGQVVKVGGIVLAAQRPGSANGMAFLTVEDSDGKMQIVLIPEIYERDRNEIGMFVVVEGVIQRQGPGSAMSLLGKSIRAV